MCSFIHVNVHESKCVYLTGGAFFNVSNNVFSRKVDQYIGSIIIQSNIISIKCDHTQVWYYRAATWQNICQCILARSSEVICSVISLIHLFLLYSVQALQGQRHSGQHGSVLICMGMPRRLHCGWVILNLQCWEELCSISWPLKQMYSLHSSTRTEYGGWMELKHPQKCVFHINNIWYICNINCYIVTGFLSVNLQQRSF